MISAMMGVGLVCIPGMMSGQILAVTDPLIAIRHQLNRRHAHHLPPLFQRSEELLVSPE